MSGAHTASAREKMVARQLAARGIRDSRVLDAMGKVRRERFVGQGYEGLAYQDTALPIASGQTISQPYIVALMAEAAEIKPTDRVLEVGTGCGYAAAVLGELAEEVFTIERHANLGDEALGRLQREGYHNIHVRVGDGTEGWPDAAPFDAILVAAAAGSPPQTLKDQIAQGGRLIIPVGRNDEQALKKITRLDETAYREEDLGAVRFVPLIGQ